jgi:hypothetical protein
MVLFIPFRTMLAYLFGLVLLTTLLFGHFVNVLHYPDGSFSVRLISFLPLYTHMTPEKLSVSGTDFRQSFEIKLCYSHLFRVLVRIGEQNDPKGYPVVVRLNHLPTWIPGINRSFRKTVLPRIKPEVRQGPPKIAGTTQPLVISFNTPLREKNIRRLITADFPMKLAPQKYYRQNRIFTDKASWIIRPLRPLQREKSYRITLEPGLNGISGKKLGYRRIFHFTTVDELKVVKIKPPSGNHGVSLLPSIQIETTRNLKKGRVAIPGYQGETIIDGGTLSFIPSRVLLPESRYRISATVTDIFEETAKVAWEFSTQAPPAPLWLEVNLRVPQRIMVYQGKKVIRVIKASAGGPETPTPQGFFGIKRRGYAFYSPKWREGAYFWLQFAGDLTIHSVLFGPDYLIKAAEIAKLGQPATHGSIAVSMDDIRWLYRNLPKATPLIIHGLTEANHAKINQEYNGTRFFNYSSEFEQFRQNPANRGEGNDCGPPHKVD